MTNLDQLIDEYERKNHPAAALAEFVRSHSNHLEHLRDNLNAILGAITQDIRARREFDSRLFANPRKGAEAAPIPTTPGEGDEPKPMA